MSAEQLEVLEQLARRAVACKRWRWMPGMAFADNGDIWRVASPAHAEIIHGDRLPDLTDPATLGCLLALVREAHNAPGAFLMGSAIGQWTVQNFVEPDGYWKGLCGWHATEAEALVAALEAAP